MGQTLGMQVGLAGALQDVQAQQLDAKIQLASAQSVMRDLESQGATQTPEYIQAQMTAGQLEQVIPALDEAANSIKAQIEAEFRSCNKSMAQAQHAGRDLGLSS